MHPPEPGDARGPERKRLRRGTSFFYSVAPVMSPIVTRLPPSQ